MITHNVFSQRQPYSPQPGYLPPGTCPTPSAPNVFVLDDDECVREALQALIQTAGWRAHTFASADEFLSHAQIADPSCLVLDASLTGVSALELQQVLADRSALPIVMVTDLLDVHASVSAMKAGAVDVLLKPLNEHELLAAIRTALERSSRMLSHLRTMQELRNRYDSLTARERQVMELVAAGLLNKQVGGELGISEITVKAHRGQVMRKMGADSLPHLVRMAIALGLRDAGTH